MYTIINAQKYPLGVESAAAYIHKKWGEPSNYPFYLDAIKHSRLEEGKLPRFFLLMSGPEIIGCYGLIPNDFISRQDLMPWLCCLYIEESKRGNRLSELIFEHARSELTGSSFDTIYLTTDHSGLYEKFGWQRMEDGFEPSGKRTRIYRLQI